MIGCLVLAAGSHRRFGAAKLLHPLADGYPLIQRTLWQIQASGLPMAMVHRPDDMALLDAVSGFELQLISAHDHAFGLGHSLAAGIAATVHWQGWLICLADMPCVQPSTFRIIEKALQQNPIVIPEYQRQLGHPRGFQARFRAELMQLQGELGARALLSQYQDITRICRVNDPGILLDVDYPADLQRFAVMHTENPVLSR